MSDPSQAPPSPSNRVLPLPRLIVRVGVVACSTGKVTDGQINQFASKISPVLRDIYLKEREIPGEEEDDSTKQKRISWESCRTPSVNSRWSWIWTFVFRCLSGCFDRWQWRKKAKGRSEVAVFSPDLPEIQFLCVKDAAVSNLHRSGPGNAGFSYTGETVAALEEPTPENKSLVFRLRHHSDLLLFVCDGHPHTPEKGLPAWIEASLQDRVPVVVARHKVGQGYSYCYLETIADLNRFRKNLLNGGALVGSVRRKRLTRYLNNLLSFPDSPVEHHGHGHQSWWQRLTAIPARIKLASRHYFNPPPEPPDELPKAHAHPHSTWYHPRAAFHAFRSDKLPRRIWTSLLWRAFDGTVKKHVAAVRHFERPSLGNEPPRKGFAKIVSRLGSGLKRCLEYLANALRLAFFLIFPWFVWLDGIVRHKQGRNEPVDPVGGSFDSFYKPIMDRADGTAMSGTYGDAHRGGILASYLLAAHAVFMALLGAIFHHPKSPDPQGPLNAAAALDAVPGLPEGVALVASSLAPIAAAPDWVLILIAATEVLTIILLAALSVISQREDWHEGYVEGRILAESLRSMEFLVPLQLHTPLPRLPHYLTRDHSTPSPEAMWSLWYFRALVRMAPLPPGVTPDGPLKKLVAKSIKGQRDHHWNNKLKQELIHHVIHWASNYLFVVVFLCAAFHLAELIIHKHFMPEGLALLICAGAPALIAALHGFGAQIETERLRQRSSSMMQLLEHRRKMIEALKEQNATDMEVNLRTEALLAATLMIDEAASWSMLYKNADIHAG